MSANRITLHVTKLDAFKAWLADNGIAYRPGKGPYQVLQVQTPKDGWQVVFRKDVMPEHFTVNERLMPLVRQFIRERRKA